MGSTVASTNKQSLVSTDEYNISEMESSPNKRTRARLQQLLMIAARKRTTSRAPCFIAKIFIDVSKDHIIKCIGSRLPISLMLVDQEGRLSMTTWNVGSTGNEFRGTYRSGMASGLTWSGCGRVDAARRTSCRRPARSSIWLGINTSSTTTSGSFSRRAWISPNPE